MPTYLLNSKIKDKKTLEFLTILSNSLTLLGEKVYIKSNEYQYFDKIKIDKEIDIIIKDYEVMKIFNNQSQIQLPSYKMKYKNIFKIFLLQNKDFQTKLLSENKVISTNNLVSNKQVSQSNIEANIATTNQSYTQMVPPYNPFLIQQNTILSTYSQSRNNPTQSPQYLEDLFPAADLTELEPIAVNLKDLGIIEFSPLPKVGK